MGPIVRGDVVNGSEGSLAADYNTWAFDFGFIVIAADSAG